MLTLDDSPAPLARLRRARRRVRRTVLAHRRLLAGLLTAAAVVAGLRAVSPPDPPRVLLTVAARDLPAGAELAAGDLVAVEVPPDGVPDGAAADPLGETLAAPVRRGEPITDVRLVGSALTAGRPDLVAVPVRLPDAGMARLLEVGDRIDLFATDPQAPTDASAATTPVARDALVLALPRAEDQASDSGVMTTSTGRLVVIGISEGLVTQVAAASVRHFLTFAYAH